MDASLNNHKNGINMKRAVHKRIRQIISQYIFLGAIPFISAGRLDWGWAWIYLAVSLCILIFNMLVLLPIHPELVAERSQEKKDTKTWDRVLTRGILVFTLIGLVVAGLDKRYAWTPDLPVWIHILGLILYALGQLLFTWSMTANKFFATTVRIQEDLGQVVAQSGPYRYVRHPGYVGMILSMVAFPIALGTLWVFIPYGLGIVGYFIRTAMEDKILSAELDGYSHYTQSVKYRLLPGVW